MPLVSVVLNCYRQAPFVREAVESVLAQTFSDFELIAIDNGSPDETPNILRQYAGNPRVRLFLHTDNCTVSTRFNEGVRAARGELIAFLYSDDFFLPAKLETQVRLFENAPAGTGVVYGPLRIKNERTGALWTGPALRMASGDDTLTALLAQTGDTAQIDMISPLTRRECFLRHPFLDQVFAEGEAIFLRIGLTHRFLFDATPVAVMRDTGENRGKAIRVNVEMHEKTLEALERDPAFDGDRYASLVRAYRARLLRNAGFGVSRVGGDLRWAREAITRAIALSPRDALHYRTLVGLGLLALPSPLRARLNALAHRVRGRKESTTTVAGYGGSSGS